MKKSLTKITSAVLSALLLIMLLPGCGSTPGAAVKKDGRVSVVATIFPAYDFARAVAGDRADITMLLPPGSEIHSYEPTPQDIIRIQNCDVFIYNGGDSDAWVDDVLSSIKNDMIVVRMTGCVKTLDEENKAGMTVHEEGGEEPDEHVRTSPVNAEKISAAIEKALAEKDPAGAEDYAAALENYTAELQKLDTAFRNTVDSGVRRTLVFADRFPVRYFTEEYGLDYYAAYPGCAEDAEPSAKTVAFLIDKVRQEKVPYVLYIEFSNEKMADVICEDTGCGKLEFDSCHNVSKADFDSGTTYLELMWKNVDTLRKALG